MEVKGKGVFLTGAAKGIGRALLETLLAKGAKVLFCDISADVGQATETEVRKQYGADNVIFVQCDVTDADQLRATFDKAVSTFGAVDICVNNAGILDERIWEKMIATNTTAQIRGSQLALEHMRRDKGGRGGVIINTVSLAGIIAAYFHPVYTATKHAMVGFTQSWATNPRMTSEMGVRWGCLCPGPVDTDLAVLEDGKTESREEYQQVVDKLIQKPAVVVEAFMMMLEDENSNGAIMAVWAGQSGPKYRKRQLVDEDGVSNPHLVDIPLSV